MPKQRDHIPSLSGKRLKAAVQAINRLPFNKHAKAALGAMLVEAGTPNRHSEERLDLPRQTSIQRQTNLLLAHTETRLARIAGAVAQLDEAALDAMSAEEFEAFQASLEGGS